MEVTISRESLAEINGNLPALTNYLTNTFTDMGAVVLILNAILSEVDRVEQELNKDD